MKCPFCGNDNDSILRFCLNCGQEILHCPRCDTPLLYRSKICDNCGTALAPELTIRLPERDNAEELLAEKKRREEEEKNRKALEEQKRRQAEALAAARAAANKTNSTTSSTTTAASTSGTKSSSGGCGCLIWILLLAGILFALVKFTSVGEVVMGYVHPSNTLPTLACMVEETEESETKDKKKKETEESTEAPTLSEKKQNKLNKQFEQAQEDHIKIWDKNSNGKTTVIEVEEGIRAWYVKDSLVAIFADKGVLDVPYDRQYFYKNNFLFYAIYDGADRLDFYVKDTEVYSIWYQRNLITKKGEWQQFNFEEQWKGWPKYMKADNKSLRAKAKEAKAAYDKEQKKSKKKNKD